MTRRQLLTALAAIGLAEPGPRAAETNAPMPSYRSTTSGASD